jgi:hypothetical protein
MQSQWNFELDDALTKPEFHIRFCQTTAQATALGRNTGRLGVALGRMRDCARSDGRYRLCPGCRRAYRKEG